MKFTHREDQSAEFVHLCFVKMDVKTVMGSVSIEEDIPFANRKKVSGAWYQSNVSNLLCISPPAFGVG